jgi:hypothetical protein
VALVFIIACRLAPARIRMIAGNAGASTANRQQRRIEPVQAGEAFDLVEARSRMPRTEEVEAARDSLQLRAKVQRIDPYGNTIPLWKKMSGWLGIQRNQIYAIVTPRDGVGSVTLICEPEGGAWSDWFLVDDGTNLENEATPAPSAHYDRRRSEQPAETVTQKELAWLRLAARPVEPHFCTTPRAKA